MKYKLTHYGRPLVQILFEIIYQGCVECYFNLLHGMSRWAGKVGSVNNEAALVEVCVFVGYHILQTENKKYENILTLVLQFL